MKNLCKSVIKQRKKIEKKHKGLSPKEAGMIIKDSEES